MIYVYRRPDSDGARLLAAELQGKYAQNFNHRHQRTAGDAIICWGERDPQVPGIAKVLNGAPLRSKYEDAIILNRAGVPTIRVNRQRPTQRSGSRGLFEVPSQSLDERTARNVMEAIRSWLDAPVPTAETWLPRANYHQGGDDLIEPPASPGFWSRFEKLTNEYRIHFFQGRSIRAGIKKPRRNFEGEVHPWNRSFDTGWDIYYLGFSSTPAMRELAGKALEALNLDFGAIDMGEREDGSLVVLEVNRAPALKGESNTTVAYANAIRRWLAA